jgi:type VI secretion system protein ImpK
MQASLAEMVFPVLRDGLVYRARLLAKSRTLTLKEVQANLRRLLSVSQAPVFVGNSDYLGIRYALTCWLDELFVDHSPWGDEWKDDLLEMAIFQTRHRSWKFWEQAKLAAQLSQFDALEVFYLCVMLGFRGSPGDADIVLDDWREAVELQFNPDRPEECPLPAERPPPVNAPPRLARDGLRQALMISVGTVITLTVPFYVCAIVYMLAKS